MSIPRSIPRSPFLNFLWIVVFLSPTSPLSASEMLLYREPPFTILDAPLPGGRMDRELKFVREYFIEKTTFAALPAVTAENERPILTPDEASAISKAAAASQYNPTDFSVTSVRLLQSKVKDPHQIDFYHIRMQVNGSEVHRIVLMNRTLVEQKLKRLKE